MTEPTPPIQNPKSRIQNRLVLGLLALCLVVAVAFLVGRRTATVQAGATEGQVGETGSHDEHEQEHEGHDHEHEGHDHEGVIRFSPAAMEQAGVRVEPVATTPVQAQLQVTGAVEPNIAGLVQVTPRVSGKVTALRATIGAAVRAGQVLATVTSTELAAAQAQYRQARAKVAAAQANLRRQRQLAGFGEFGQHKVQQAREAFNAAEGDVNEALAALAAARNEVAEAEAALAAAQSDQTGIESDVVAAQTALLQAKTQVEVSRSRFNRQEALLKEELTSRQDWEQARADYQKAQTDVLAAEAALRSVQAKVAAAHAKVHQAHSVMQTQQAQVRQAEAKLAAARQRLAMARTAREREEKVFRSGVYASKEVADAEAALRQAEIERTTASDAVRLLGGAPGGGHTVGVASPIAGRVTERRVSIGESVSPEKPLFTVLNLDTVWVQLNVYQRDLPAVRAGLPVTITTEAVPGQQFSGKVTYISDMVEEATRTVKVRSLIPNPRGLLKPDMFVRGRIATEARGQRVTLPRDAVQTLEGRTVVFVLGEHVGEFLPRPIETGETVDGRTVITTGLSPGETVVTRGAFMVKAQAMKSELGHSHGH